MNELIQAFCYTEEELTDRVTDIHSQPFDSVVQMVLFYRVTYSINYNYNDLKTQVHPFNSFQAMLSLIERNL